MKELFLDCNAHLPLNPKAAQAYLDFCNSRAGHGHPSSPSAPGRLAANAFEDARGKIALLIGASKPGQIIFTAGCTQACEWGLELLFRMDGETNTPYSVATSTMEHPAVRDAFSTLFSEYCVEGETNYITTDENGVAKYSEGAYIYSRYNKTCCIHVQNEIGIIQPIDKINGGRLFSDMSQSLGKIPVNVSNLNVDIAVFGAHKFGGPGGFGFIYLKDTNCWESFGAGSRYFLDRTGTPDVASAVATAVALEEAVSTLEARTQNMIAFQTTLEDGLDRMGIEVICKKANRSPNTTFISLPHSGLLSLFKLGEQGIHVGLGSACGSMHAGTSQVMKALGRSGGVQDFLRISQFGEYGEEEAKIVLEALKGAL